MVAQNVFQESIRYAALLSNVCTLQVKRFSKVEESDGLLLTREEERGVEGCQNGWVLG